MGANDRVSEIYVKKVIGKALLRAHDLETIITQIECRLNDRPLTYLSSDIKDVQPLTPAQLMFGYKLIEFPDLISQEEIDDPTFGSKDNLSKIYLHRTKILKEFWSRWSKEYLTALRERFSTGGRDSSVAIGDVVLIHNSSPRLNWKMGIIVELLSSCDGSVRSVKVKTNTGILIRPICKLYPLEIQCMESKYVKPIIEQFDCPRRDAAIKALEAMKVSY